MSDLSTEQLELKASIKNSATIWGAVIGIIVVIIAWFVLGSLGTAVQAIGALLIGGAAGLGIYRWQYGVRSKSAECTKCNAAFSITRTDRQETLAGSEDRVEREPQDDGSTEITRFTEKTYDVVDSYTCASCGDVTTKQYQTRRRENVQTKIDPAPIDASAIAPTANPAARGGTSATPGKATSDPAEPKAPSAGLGRGGSGAS